MGYKKKESKSKVEMSQAGEKPEVKTYKKSKVVVEVKKEAPYKVLMWAGVKEVYACTKCKWQEDKKDDAILHYLSHYPKRDRNRILDNLIKEL